MATAQTSADAPLASYLLPEIIDSLPRQGWIRLAVVGVLFAKMHSVIIEETVKNAMRNPDWSHALIVPFFSLYLLYCQRAKLRELRTRECWWGLPLMLGGSVCYFVGNYIHTPMVMGAGALVELLGIGLLLTGPEMMKGVLWLPICYLAFAVDISIILDPVSQMLQRLSSACAAVSLDILGSPINLKADCVGVVIYLHKDGFPLEPPLNIAEACSGLRMLMAMMALGVAMAYLTDRSWWVRLIIVLLSPPIAVICNVFRVTLLGLIYPYNKAWSVGAFHTQLGMTMLIPAMILLFTATSVLEHLEEGVAGEPDGEDEQAPAEAAPVAPPAMGPWPWPTRPLLTPAFGIVVTLLALGSFTKHQVASALDVSLEQQSIGLQRSLTEIPAEMGPYRRIKQQSYSEFVENELGTKDYIDWIYADTRLIPQVPGSALRFHVTYYTGTENTMWIWHVPEVCYVGSGSRPIDVSRREIQLAPSEGTAKLTSGAGGTPLTVPLRYFVFEPPGRQTPGAVAYFFIANNRLYGSKSHVRFAALDMTTPYVYYCKVEVSPGTYMKSWRGADVEFAPVSPGEDATLKAVHEFLDHALPEVMKCLPDWAAIKAGEDAQ